MCLKLKLLNLLLEFSTIEIVGAMLGRIGRVVFLAIPLEPHE